MSTPQLDVLTLRLALGIEPADPVRGGRIGHPLTAAIDGVPIAPSRTQRDPDLPPWAPQDLASRGSTRFDVYSLAATLLQCVTGWESIHRCAPRG